MGEPSQLKRALIDAGAGAISSAISRTVPSPLDVIKIRFQLMYNDGDKAVGTSAELYVEERLKIASDVKWQCYTTAATGFYIPFVRLALVLVRLSSSLKKFFGNYISCCFAFGMQMELFPYPVI